MTSDRTDPEDVWPSLTQEDMERAADPEQDDPGWMAELSPVERDAVRRESRRELEMMQRVAERRSQDGHPMHGDDWRVEQVPSENGGFKRVVMKEDETGTE